MPTWNDRNSDRIELIFLSYNIADAMKCKKLKCFKSTNLPMTL